MPMLAVTTTSLAPTPIGRASASSTRLATPHRPGCKGRCEDAELVAAEPGHGVERPDGVQQLPRCLGQDLVADVVSVIGVVVLQIVKIDEPHGDGWRSAGRARQPAEAASATNAATSAVP